MFCSDPNFGNYYFRPPSHWMVTSRHFLRPIKLMKTWLHSCKTYFTVNALMKVLRFQCLPSRCFPTIFHDTKTLLCPQDAHTGMAFLKDHLDTTVLDSPQCQTVSMTLFQSLSYPRYESAVLLQILGNQAVLVHLLYIMNTNHQFPPRIPISCYHNPTVRVL